MLSFFFAAHLSSAKKREGKITITQSSSIKLLQLIIQSPGKGGISSG
jgi:hypothetical protein